MPLTLTLTLTNERRQTIQLRLTNIGDYTTVMVVESWWLHILKLIGMGRSYHLLVNDVDMGLSRYWFLDNPLLDSFIELRVSSNGFRNWSAYTYYLYKV